MAELSERKKQNQAFLQQLEQQRLAKPCQRNIDLRGRVVGECQPYDIDGCRHYLDDRSFLLLKQLMARFNQRYTIGVYEALLKAVKHYAPSHATDSETGAATPRLFHPLDSRIERQSARLKLTLPLEIQFKELRYHASTLDISQQALRVALKRSHSLAVGMIVTVTFSDIDLPPQTYQLIRLEHESQTTRAVLLRQSSATLPDEPDAFSLWFNQQHDQQPIDLQNELLNLQSTLYQRLWLSQLSPVVAWLTGGEQSPELSAIQLSATAQDLLQQQQLTITSLLSSLPLNKLMPAEPTSYLLAFDAEQRYLAQANQTDRVKQLLAWQQAGAQRHLFQVIATPISVDKQADDSHHLDTAQRTLILATHHQLIFTDITGIQNAVEIANPDKIPPAPLNDSALPLPQSFYTASVRQQPRFYIKTPVTAHYHEQTFELETLDVSVDGVQIELPITDQNLLGQRIEIDFIRWQTLAKDVTLSRVPYLVKNQLLWQGKTRLGLARLTAYCATKVNQFFTEVIEQNQSKLRLDMQHLRHQLESQLLLPVMTSPLPQIPVFFGLNAVGQRQIQLIGETASNQAQRYPDGFWQALPEHITWLMDNELKREARKQSHRFILFAYQSTLGGWKLMFEPRFSSRQEKGIFIRLGLKSPTFYVFDCTLSPITQTEINTQQDLLLSLAQHPAHQSQSFRQQLSQLTTLVQLTDMSELTLASFAF